MEKLIQEGAAPDPNKVVVRQSLRAPLSTTQRCELDDSAHLSKTTTTAFLESTLAVSATPTNASTEPNSRSLCSYSFSLSP